MEAFTSLENNYISNKCCSIELSINQTNPKNSALPSNYLIIFLNRKQLYSFVKIFHNVAVFTVFLIII